MLLFQVGVVLLLSFTLLAILGSLPLAIGTPEWNVRFIANLQNLALTALTGTVFIVLSQGFDRSNPKLRSRVRFARKASIWAMIAWLLLIPLQISAGFNIVQKGLAGQKQETLYFRKVQKRLQMARTQQQLRAAIAMVPNTPIEFTVTGDVPTIGKQLADQMGQRIKASQEQVEEENRERIQAIVLAQSKSCLYSILIAAGFASIAQASPSSPTILSRIGSIKLFKSLGYRLRF